VRSQKKFFYWPPAVQLYGPPYITKISLHKQGLETSLMTGTSSVCQFYDSPRQLICFWRTFFLCAKLIYSSVQLPGSHTSIFVTPYYQPNTLAGAINNFFIAYPQKYENCSTLTIKATKSNLEELFFDYFRSLLKYLLIGLLQLEVF
jgi:hypothetical protein